MTHKVLVTGGAGYVGSVLCKHLLDNDYTVSCMDILVKGDGDSLLPIIDRPNFEFINENILSKKIKPILDSVDSVIHLAGVVGFPKCAKDPKGSYLINVEGTKNIVNNLSGQRLVFASTGSVYGALSNICTEESPLNPQSEYGEQKRIAEEIVSSYSNSVSYRFATACGVSNSMRVNLLVNNLVYDAVHKRAITLFEPHAKRTFINVNDMARAFIHGLENYNEYKVYNCGDNMLNMSKLDIANIIKKYTNCELFIGDYLKDKDKRDYEVSYEKLNNSYNFRCHIVSMNYIINSLVDSVKLLNVDGRYF